MSNVRCRRNFKRMRVDELDLFATGVRDGIYGNPVLFTTPPMDQAAFQVFIDAYMNTRAAYKNGGSAQKGAYQVARANLLDELVNMAEYVDELAKGNEALITTAGFVPTKGSASTAPPPVQPTGVILRHGSTGVLRTECANQPQVDTYLCILTPGAPIPQGISVSNSGQIVVTDTGGDAQPAGPQASATASGFIMDLNKSRRKVFSGLVPGTIYYVTFIAINAQGVSPLSSPTGLMCV